MRRLWLFLFGLVWLPAHLVLGEDPAPETKKESAAAGTALLLHINGAIGPAISHYISQGIKRAAEDGNAVVILRMDTPGGLDTAMRDIIKDILASPVPVVTFVSPSGARAASAGTYILYASHIAAMSPATNLGSATPVPVGGEPPPQPTPLPTDDKKSDQDNGKADEDDKAAPLPGGAMERKVINDAVAYLRSLAQLRGRNAEFAEKAVREGANLPADEALERFVHRAGLSAVADCELVLGGREAERAGHHGRERVGELRLEHRAFTRDDAVMPVTLVEEKLREYRRQADLSHGTEVAGGERGIDREHGKPEVLVGQDRAELADHLLDAHVGAGVASADVAREEQLDRLAGTPLGRGLALMPLTRGLDQTLHRELQQPIGIERFLGALRRRLRGLPRELR